MKTFKKIFGIIAMVAIIAAGLSGCITITAAPEPTEEELALRNSLENASWKVDNLANQPSLDGYEKISKMVFSDSEWAIRVESTYFLEVAGSNESDRGRTIPVITKRNGVESTTTKTLIGMNANTWYKLTAPEMPGITYYYFRTGGTIITTSIYKNIQ
jgi:hypothetical protein